MGSVVDRIVASYDHGQGASHACQEQDQPSSNVTVVRQTAEDDGVGFTSRALRITVGIMSRTALFKTPCVKGGTHP
jgi:hypothetical protein